MDEQLTLFSKNEKSPELPDDVLKYVPGLFSPDACATFLNTLIQTIQWEHRELKMYGKNIMTPRLTAWYGAREKNYTYSGNRFSPLPWTPELLTIKACVEPHAGVSFNSVLLNYYRDHNDSVAWHSDNESELGRQPIIASLSFGQVRRFDIRKKNDHNKKRSVSLEDGSLLLMKGDLQQDWEHRIAKSVTPMKARVNLTFRIIQ